MQGIVFDIQQFTVHDGPGIRTAVFMKGCPLRCPWCQNPESVRKEPQIAYFPELCIGCNVCASQCPSHAVRASGKKLIEKVYLAMCSHCGQCASACCSGALRMIGKSMTVEEVTEVVMRDFDFYRNSGGGVTFTGGEPTYQPEFFTAMAKEFKRRGLHQVIESCGDYEWESVADALGLMDIFYLDVKHVNSKKHEAVIGRSNTRILENARRIDAFGKPIRIRVPLIPGFNDSPEDFRETLRFARTLSNLDKVQVLPYHKYGITKYENIGWGYSLEGIEPPAQAQLSALLDIAASEKVPCTL